MMRLSVADQEVSCGRVVRFLKLYINLQYRVVGAVPSFHSKWVIKVYFINIRSFAIMLVIHYTLNSYLYST